MKKTSKWLILMLLFSLVLSACGGAATQAPATEPPAAEPQQPEPQPEATEPPAAMETFRVAVVMPSAINDLAFSQSIYDALMAI